MESSRNLRIVVDAGHGGWDNGASFEGRVEKDDNLRLALAVERELRAQGVDVVMTRSTDEYIPLADRAAIANQSGADLFISLHRNSYVELTPGASGVENFIYLTAPMETSGRAAQLVLDEVVDVGVLADRGVKRGNYYVLRRTNMPAMLLEMGYIINPADNELFDQNLEQYAQAVARGALRYFGRAYSQPAAQPPAQVPETAAANSAIAQAQRLLNDAFGADIPVTGVFDEATRTAAVAALQQGLNGAYVAGLTVDGQFSPETVTMLRPVRRGEAGELPFLLQVLLLLNGYSPGAVDGVFGGDTENALELFQRDHYLTPDGVAGQATLRALLDL